MELPKDRLQQARMDAGFRTPSEAAAAIRALNKNTLISNENGNRPISRKAAEKYAKAFGVSAGWLLYGDEEPESREQSIPLVSMVSAGRLRDQAGVLPTDIEKWIRVSDLPPGDWIALTVDGDSMDRIAPDGATLVVNRADSTLIDSKYYVFSLAGGQATFKRYRRSPERLQPFSTNPDHTSIPVDGHDLYVFGRVRRIIQDV